MSNARMPHASRRNLLMAGATGAAALLAGRVPTFGVPAGSSSAAARLDAFPGLPPFIKLSLAGYSFRKQLDTEGKKGEMSLIDLADLCAKLGLGAVEPTSYYFFSTDDDFVYNLKRHIMLLGLEVSGMPINNNFALPDGPDFDKQFDHVRKWIDVAAKLGAPNMRVFAGRPGSMERDAAISQVIKGLRKCSDYAATKGVFLALENHGYLTETADDVIRIIEGVDHPWFAGNLDTGNFKGKPYENIRKLAPYCVVAQVKSEVSPEPGKKAPADYARIVGILREINYRGYVALEYEGADPLKAVPVEIEKLRAALEA